MASRTFVTTAKDFPSISLTFDYPDTIEEFADRFGLDNEGVLRHAAADLIIAAQNSIKARIKKGEPVDTIQEWLDQWKVGTRVAGGGAGRAPGKKSTLKGLEKMLEGATPDQRGVLEGILEQLKALQVG